MSRFVRSLALAAAASALVAVAGVVLHLLGLQFATSAVPLINTFLLILILVQKEINYESVAADMRKSTDEVVGEIRAEKEAILELSKRYETLSRDHQQRAQQALGKIEETAERVTQAVVEGVAGAPPGWKPNGGGQQSSPG